MKKYRISIIIICIIIVITTAFFVSKNILSDDKANVVLDKEEIVEYGEENSDKILEINVGDNDTLKKKLELSDNDKIELISNSNQSVLEINDDLSYKAVSEGEAQLELLVNNEKYEANFIVNSVIDQATTSSVFQNIDSCNKNGKQVYSNKNTNITLKRCVTEYNSGAFQNIAITDKYFYISKNNSVTIPNGSKINGNWFVRIDRSGKNKRLIMKVPYTGHGQSFDVVEQRTDHGDTLLFNYISVPKTVGNFSVKDNKGFGVRSFYGTINGEISYPHRAYAIKTKGSALSIKTLTRDSFLPTINANSNDNEITKIAKNNQYSRRPQIATSKEDDLIVIHDYNATNRTYFYIYRLNDFLNGKLTKVNAFKSDFYYGQGIEVYKNYIYAYGDKGKTEHYMKKYNIKTGKLEKTVYFKTGKSEEGEGISIYKGKIYIACKYNTGEKRKLNLYLVDGI